MSSISLRINKEEERLIRAYAEANKISVSELFRTSVLEKIEDNIDLDLYHQAMKEHQNNPNDISFDEMINELDLPQ